MSGDAGVRPSRAGAGPCHLARHELRRTEMTVQCQIRQCLREVCDGRAAAVPASAPPSSLSHSRRSFVRTAKTMRSSAGAAAKNASCSRTIAMRAARIPKTVKSSYRPALAHDQPRIYKRRDRECRSSHATSAARCTCRRRAASRAGSPPLPDRSSGPTLSPRRREPRRARIARSSDSAPYTADPYPTAAM